MVTAYDSVLKPMVDSWKGLLNRAKDAKQEFNDRGAQVEAFYNGAAGFMFNSKYTDKFMKPGGGFKPPTFKITFNKAFEFIAVMWPMLFWQMADRKVKPYRAMEVENPAALAGNDPMMQDLVNRVLNKQAENDAKSVMRAKVQEQVLNMLPRLQPDGGLVEHAAHAVFDALLKGVGFLTTEAYRYPGSERNLVGSFYVSSDRVLVDADCQNPLWTDAGYVAIYHEWRVDKAEDFFGLPPGSLQQYASKSSAGAQYNNDPNPDTPKGPLDKAAKNVICWYEIFSRAGTGNKLTGKQKISPEFDRVAGDNVYLCICPDCPWPLNLSGMDFEKLDSVDSIVEEQDAWLRDKLRWPTEYWRHNDWPVNKLSFYPMSTRSAWPLPPLSPAIGEMTVANILISAYTQIGYDNRQQILGVFEGMCDNLEQLLASSTSPVVIRLKNDLHKTVGDVLQFAKRPEINGDVTRLIEFLFGLIEQRTGMSPVLYGQGGETNSRSAAEYTGRRETVNIRPDFMRKRVGEWMSQTAGKELFCVYTHMGTADVADDVGPFWALVWDQLVQNEDPEVVLRSSECYVEASDIGRPNHERDAQMLSQMQQYLMPILAGYMAQTGNPQALNGFLKAFGQATNMDVTPFLIPVPATPDEQQQLAQQVQQQLETQRLQAEIAKLQAEAQKTGAEAQAVGARIQNERMVAEAKIEQSRQQVNTKVQEGQIRLAAAQQQGAQKAQLMQQQATLAQQQAEHSMSLKQQAAEMQAALAEHGATIKERDAEARAQVTDAQAGAKAQDMQMRQAEREQQAQTAHAAQVNQAEMAAEQHMQGMAQREATAKQKLMTDLLASHQNMQIAQQQHEQTMAIQNQETQADARRSNMIMQQKLLMAATEAAKRQQSNSEGAKA